MGVQTAASFKSAVHLVAVLFKRCWVDDSKSSPQIIKATAQAFLSQLKQLLETQQSDKIRIAAAVCTNVLSEFSTSHSTAIGVTWHYHVACHRAFEVRYYTV